MQLYQWYCEYGKVGATYYEASAYSASMSYDQARNELAAFEKEMTSFSNVFVFDSKIELVEELVTHVKVSPKSGKGASKVVCLDPC